MFGVIFDIVAEPSVAFRGGYGATRDELVTPCPVRERRRGPRKQAGHGVTAAGLFHRDTRTRKSLSRVLSTRRWQVVGIGDHVRR